eukprot:Skav223462  [mRNA]  locus=scaffold2238:15223:15877:+ [translate_table: standard]
MKDVTFLSKAELDAQLLANRIALLKQEEEKATGGHGSTPGITSGGSPLISWEIAGDTLLIVTGNRCYWLRIANDGEPPLTFTTAFLAIGILGGIPWAAAALSVERDECVAGLWGRAVAFHLEAVLVVFIAAPIEHD